MPADSRLDGPYDRYKELLDAAPDAMLVVGSDGIITFANLETERLFGYPPPEIVGQPLDLLIPERFRGGHGLHVHRFFERPTRRPMGSGIELFGRRRDGSELPVEVSLSPVRSSEGPAVC